MEILITNREGNKAHLLIAVRNLNTLFMWRSILFLVFLLGVEKTSAFSISSKYYFRNAAVSNNVKRELLRTKTSIYGIPNFILCSSKSCDNELKDFNSKLKEETKCLIRQQHSLSSDNNNNDNNTNDQSPDIFRRVFDQIPFIHLLTGPDGRKKVPPVQIDDSNVLFYDVLLIINLSLSISFWVTHRLNFDYIPSALNEGCLFSILWILSGLYHGSFLYSSMDGHYPLDDEENRGGPKAAALLAFNTYVNAINLRLIFALIGAFIQHRKVGVGIGEELLPLEITCGLILMTMWRALHSQITPRI